MKKICALAMLVGVCASLNAGGAYSKGTKLAKDTYKVICTRDGKFDTDRTLVRGTAVVVAGKWLKDHSPVYVGYESGARFYRVDKLRLKRS